MSGTFGERRGGESGAVVVEAALVLPILLTLLMGLFDFGIMELRQSQVSSAARDGARAGIVNWTDAQLGTYSGGSCPSTPGSFNTICAAVLRRMAGTPVSSIAARCIVAATDTPTSCTDAGLRGGIDYLQVTVSTVFTPPTVVGRTFLGNSRTTTSRARMVIQ